jgi:hypothetical protein
MCLKILLIALIQKKLFLMNWGLLGFYEDDSASWDWRIGVLSNLVSCYFSLLMFIHSFAFYIQGALACMYILSI